MVSDTTSQALCLWEKVNRLIISLKMGKNGFWGKPVQTQGTLHFSSSQLVLPHLYFENFYPTTLALWLFPRSPTQGVGPQAYTIYNKLKQTKKEKQNKTDGVGRWEYSTRSFLSEESQNIPQIFSSTSSLIFIFIARKNLWASYTEVKPQGNHASPVSHSEHIRSASPAIKYWPQVGFTKSLTHKSRRDIDAIKLRKILVQPGWFFFFNWMDDT